MLNLTVIAILLTPWAGMLLATRWLLNLPAPRERARLFRWLWALPMLGYLVWAAKLLHDTARDPTSHNLWPLEMMVVLAAWGAYAGALWLALRLAGLIRPDRGRPSY